MKKSIITLAMVSSFAVNAAYLNEETGEVVVPENQEILGEEVRDESATEKVNYGDPTASYKGLGLTTGSKGYKQANFVYGAGSHIFSGDLGTTGNKDINYRGRYFNIDQETNFGWSIDFLGSHGKKDGEKTDSNTVLVGGLYKYQMTDNILLAPMLYGGYTTEQTKNEGVKTKRDSYLGQAGLYAMYGFDAGHWLYVNPKSTYVAKAKDWVNQVEIGGGFMVTDSSSLGFKSELSKVVKEKTEWLNTVNYYVYF